MSKDKKKKNWFWRLFTICFWVGILFAIIFTVLSNIGGNSLALKESIEQYLRETTPYDPRVGRLNHMNFFPLIIIDFDNLELRDENNEEAISVQKTLLAASFWDVIIRSGKIKAFDLKKVRAAPETVLRRPLSIERLGVLTHSETKEAILRGDGFIGSTPIFLSLDLDVFGTIPQQKYRIGKQKSLELGLGDYLMTTEVQDIKTQGMSFKNLQVKKQQDQILSGTLELRREAENILITGNLKLPQSTAHWKPDLVLRRSDTHTKISGKITTGAVTAEDLEEESALNKFIKTITQHLAFPDDEELIWDVQIQTPEGLKDLRLKDHYLSVEAP